MMLTSSYLFGILSIMACSECKKKQSIKDEISRVTEPFEKGVLWFTVIWGVLGLYGLVTLIGKFL